MKINSKQLKALCFLKFRFHSNYHYTASEVGYYNSDILASNGNVVKEFEIKTSYSDFVNDFKKRKHKIYSNINKYPKAQIPHEFNFLVSNDIADKCKIYLEKHNYIKYGLYTLSSSGLDILAGSIKYINGDPLSCVIKPKKLHSDKSKNEKILYSIVMRMGSDLGRYYIRSLF